MVEQSVQKIERRWFEPIPLHDVLRRPHMDPEMPGATPGRMTRGRRVQAPWDSPITIAFLVLVLTACSPMIYTHGVPNLTQVDTNIYRSGQITTQEGWSWIATIAHGRRVHVIKLNFDTEGSDKIATEMGFDVQYLPVQPEGDQSIWNDVESAFEGPDPVRIDQGLSTLRYCKQHENTDVCLGHCTHGQDRTGLLFGEHRVINDGWTKKAAYQEMLDHHFHPELHGVHEAWENFKSP